MVPRMDDRMNPDTAPTGDDPVVAEVRAAREALFAEAGFDLEALGQLLRERQAAAGRVGVVLSPRAPEPPSQAA
jgi:hypothetical protein